MKVRFNISALILLSISFLLITGCTALQTEESKAENEHRIENKTRELVIYSEDGHRIERCIGAVVMGVCHGEPSPGDEIRNRTGTNSRCYGNVIGSRCIGPEF